MTESTALERVEAADIEERKRINRLLISADVMAGGSLLKEDLRKDTNARTVAITLDQLGVPVTINNMNACFVIKGAVGMMTWLWCAVANAIGGHEVWLDEESNAEVGIAHLRRADTGVVRTVRFTIDDASKAGLLDGTNKDTYAKWTTDMLGWRALSRVINRYAPEVKAGMAAAGALPGPVMSATQAQYLSSEDPDDEPVDAEIVEEGRPAGSRMAAGGRVPGAPPLDCDPETGEVQAAPAQIPGGGAGASSVASAPPGPSSSEGADSYPGSRGESAAVREQPARADAPSGDVDPDEWAEFVRWKQAQAAPVDVPEAVDAAPAAPLPRMATGGVDWRHVCKQHGITQGDLLRQAQEFARSRDVAAPETLAEITDEQVIEDLREWVG